jgi:hypothetical protein
MRILITSCLLVVASPIGSKVLACTCANESPETARASGDLIFIGSVIHAQQTRYTFAIKEVLKGTAGQEITVDAGGPCRTSFKLGSTYIVSVGSTERGYLTGACSGNRWLNDAEANIIAQEREPNDFFVLAILGFGAVLVAGLVIWLYMRKAAT